MSETVHYKGTAILIAKEDKAEIEAEKILNNRGFKKSDYHDTFSEALGDELYKEYFYHKKTKSLYSIDYTDHDLEEEIIEAKYVGFDNSQIGFELRYYNGGAGFEECLQEAMDKLK
ncbi:MAG: glycosidase [Flavobacteriaceae bacterium]|jgi:glycosidase